MKIPSLHLPAEFIHCLDLLMMKRKAQGKPHAPPDRPPQANQVAS